MDLNTLLAFPGAVEEYSSDEIISILDPIKQLFDHRSESTFIDAQPDTHPESDKPKLVILGDTHGDQYTAKSAVEEFFFEKPVTVGSSPEPAPGRQLLFLGDYVDRVPRHIRNGSLGNIMYVLALKMQFPDRVVLLRGNHETFEVTPPTPHTFPDELYARYGEDGYQLLDGFKTIFRLLPLMYRTHNGVYAAHGGVFRHTKKIKELTDLERSSLKDIAPPTWSEPREYCAPRPGIGEIFNFNRAEFDDFMAGINANVMVRGHSPDLVGRTIYGGGCLTVFTTESYLHRLGERSTGAVIVDLDREIDEAGDLQLYLRSRGHWLPVKADPIEKNNKH